MYLRYIGKSDEEKVAQYFFESGAGPVPDRMWGCGHRGTADQSYGYPGSRG